MDFPGSSAGKESVCNAGDPVSIPGSGRSSGKGTGYPLQYSWAFLVAQTVKNPPAVQETWVGSLGWEDPLEEDMATHYSIIAWRIPPWTEEPGGLQSIGSQKVRHDWATKHNMDLVKNFPSLMWNIHFFSFQNFLLIFTRTSVTRDIFW